MANILAGRSKVILTFLLLFGPAFILIFISTRSCEHKFQILEDYGTVKQVPFEVYGQSKKFTFNDFKGDIVLITTLQKTCPGDCAISFWHLDQLIYQNIRKNKSKKMKRIRMISFATDGKGNPLTLNELGEIEEAIKDNVEEYDPEIWMLATGDVQSVYNFKHNGANLLAKGDKYYGGHAFQELVLLLDKQGHLRMVLRGTEEGLIRKMRDYSALLQKQYDKENKKHKK